MKTATPPDTYLKEAFVVLEKLGVIVQTPQVTEWLSQQHQRDVPVKDIAASWNAADNAANVRSAAATARVTYLNDELARRITRIVATSDELAQKLAGADITQIAGLAAEKAEALVECTVKRRVFEQYARAIANAKERNESDGDMFERLSLVAFRELASLAAAASSQSSSWQNNAESHARIAALGEVASYFLDVAKISLK